jgi:Domain of unknown function (DUF4281)
MNIDEIFVLANRFAIAAWVLLVIGLFAPPAWSKRALFIAGRVMPVVLCVGYVIALVNGWGSAPGGGFSTLDGVKALFASKPILLGAWIHYLAFDLLVGRWITDQSMAAGSSTLLKVLTVPCLFATLMFGPLGLLLYLAILRLFRSSANNA